MDYALPPWLAGAFQQAFYSLAVTLPFATAAVLWARRQGRQVNYGILGGVALFFIAIIVLVQAGEAAPFVRQPWQSMLFETALALLAIFAVGGLVHAGVTLRISAQAWRACLIATGLAAVYTAVRSLGLNYFGLGTPPPQMHTEMFLYLLTMPGIAEELAYRGVMQPWLNRVFGRPWRVFGAQIGWGWVLTGVVFWAMHAFRLDDAFQVSFYWPTLTMPLVMGIIMGWMRERSGSIVPGILAHNLVNLVWAFI